MSKSNRTRRIIFWIFVILFGAYVITHLKELQNVLQTLAQGSWRLLFVAVITQALFYLVFSVMTKWSFKTVGINRDIKDLIPLVLGSLFVNTLAPTAGQSGVILFADDAARRKESSARAIVGYLISIISSYTSFSLILIFSLFYLSRIHLLDTYEIIGALIFILPATMPTILMVLAVKKPETMEKILKFFYTLISKIKKLFRSKTVIRPEWTREVAEELKLAGESVIGHKKELSISLSLALVAHIINIISLFVIFLSFDIHVRYGALIAGYAFAEVVRVISPHPEGVGAVEAVMILLYTSFGVPPIDATAIAITFRVLNFWLPLGLGFGYLRNLKTFSDQE